MNLLFITWNFPPKIGGMENIIYNIWKRLGSLHTAYAITSYSKTGGALPDTRISRAPFAPVCFYLPYALIKGALIIKAKKIDIIFSGSALTCPISIILGKLFKKKVITQTFGLDVIYPDKFYQFLLSLFLPRNDRVITICRPVQMELIKRGVPGEKISIIHPGIEVGPFKMPQEKKEPGKRYDFWDKKVLLSVCRLARRKGIVEFINNSLPAIIKEFPDAIYVVAGDNPRQSLAHRDNIMEEIKAAVKNTGLENHVKLLGNVLGQDLIELYRLCSLFILPALPAQGDMEGFGVVFIEANAAGLAVIGTRTGGIPEAIEDGRSGVIVECGNYEALSRAVIGLLNNPLRMREMGNYGKERAEKEFNWDIIIKDYLALLKGLLKNEYR